MIIVSIHLTCLKSKMLAFAKWQYPHTLSPAQKAEKEASDETEKHEHPRPEGTNTELIELFKKMLRERRVKHIDQSTGYCELFFTHSIRAPLTIKLPNPPTIPTFYLLTKTNPSHPSPPPSLRSPHPPTPRYRHATHPSGSRRSGRT